MLNAAGKIAVYLRGVRRWILSTAARSFVRDPDEGGVYSKAAQNRCRARLMDADTS